jgi:hypothetical protein
VQLRSISAIQRHMNGSSSGRITSGRCVISIHFTAFNGTPGPDQGAE